MTLLACLASLLLIPLAAVKGCGYRGLYLAGAVLSGFFAFSIFNMPAGLPNPATATAAEIRGAQLFDAIAPSVGGWLMVTAVSCLIGACVFRTKPKPEPANT